jgi:putative ABC transport system permease protein
LPPVFPLPVASSGYFRAMRIPLIAGRLFGDPNDPATAHDVIVSRAFAEHYWQDPTGQKALGQQISFDRAGNWSTIVGVVESVRDTSLMAAPQGAVYSPVTVPAPSVPDSVAQTGPRVMSFVLRSSGDASALASLARRELHSLNPSIPMYDVQSMTDVLGRATARTRFVLIAVGTAAVITLLLGAVGLYGVIAYLVSLRTREFGVRLALGAEPRSVMTMVLREGVRLALIGIVGGLVLFAVLVRFLRGLLFEVNAADPLSLVVVTVILLIVATVASLVPATRAARINPLEALRAE